MRLLERLIEIVDRDVFVAIYRAIMNAIIYDTGDWADARLIMDVMNTHAQSQGFDTAGALAEYYTGNDAAA